MRFLLYVISIYQKTLSPDHGFIRGFFPYGACRFAPTCSEYAKEAFKCYGFWRGLGMSLKRVSKCHPLHPGGYDPVPKKN